MDGRLLWVVVALVVLAAGCAQGDPRGQWWNLSRCDHSDDPGWCEARERAQGRRGRLEL